MRSNGDVFGRVEARVRSCDRGGSVVEEWSSACPALASTEVVRPADVPPRVWALGREDADDVLRVLVGRAQAGDELALLVVVLCLRPGLVKLACTVRVPLDDVVAEATERVLTVRLEGRRLVAAGLILDVRKRLWLARRREASLVPVPPEELASDARPQGRDRQVPGRSAAEELTAVVADAWRGGRLGTDEARLILETRVWGHTVEVASRRRSLPRRVGYRMRARAEQRLRAHAAV